MSEQIPIEQGTKVGLLGDSSVVCLLMLLRLTAARQSNRFNVFSSTVTAAKMAAVSVYKALMVGKYQ